MNCKVDNSIVFADGLVLYPPFIGYRKNVACVYVLNYSDGSYYIGSTKCFSSRIMAHNTSSVVSVSIDRTCNEIIELRIREGEMIAAAGSDPYCRNRAKVVHLKYGRKAGKDNKIPITFYVEKSVLVSIGGGDADAGKDGAREAATQRVYQLRDEIKRKTN